MPVPKIAGAISCRGPLTPPAVPATAALRHLQCPPAPGHQKRRAQSMSTDTAARRRSQPAVATAAPVWEAGPHIGRGQAPGMCGEVKRVEGVGGWGNHTSRHTLQTGMRLVLVQPTSLKF
eukprot:353698-Chlamydomonas_euryale.AAC.12